MVWPHDLHFTLFQPKAEGVEVITPHLSQDITALETSKFNKEALQNLQFSFFSLPFLYLARFPQFLHVISTFMSLYSDGNGKRENPPVWIAFAKS